MGRTHRAAVAVVAALGLAASAVMTASAAPAPDSPEGGQVARTAVHATAAPAVRITIPSQIATARSQLRLGTLATARGTTKVCGTHHLRCTAQVVTAKKGSTTRLITGTPIGYGPVELAKAYGLAGAPKGTATIALLGAGAYPNLESDLTIYRDTYGLPRCTTYSGCLKIVDYRGGRAKPPSTDTFGQLVEELDAEETALDVQMASAACPTCRIVFVQLPWQDGAPDSLAAENVAAAHFATGTQTAVKLGAKAVSISYGYDTTPTNLTGAPAKGMRQPGVAVFSSSGDSGFQFDVGQWPQSLPTVISAGGTSLYPSATKRGYTDVAWAGAGSGCTPGLPPANGQPASVSRYCDGSRTATDVSAVADPYTGVAVYDSYSPALGFPAGFQVFGGTSVSSPFLAGAAARAGVPRTLLGPNLFYAAKKGTFTDVTIGSNAPPHGCQSVGFPTPLCVAGPGWDGPSGLGVPSGRSPFA